jgi:hypothetical protein
VNEFRPWKDRSQKGDFQTVSGGFINNPLAAASFLIGSESIRDKLLDVCRGIFSSQAIIRSIPEVVVEDEIWFVPAADIWVKIEDVTEEGGPRSWRTEDKSDVQVVKV